MRFSSDQLRDKALLALEEVLQETRYRPVRRTIMIRFALAFLWARAEGGREPFDDFWRQIANPDEMWRFQYAEGALARIHRALGVERDHKLESAMWHRAQAQFRPIGEDGFLVKPWTPPPP